MKSKIYRHKTYINTSIVVKVDGKNKKIRFGNGTIFPRKNGFVKIVDEKVQKAIEAHPDYKVKFFLEKVNGKNMADAVAGESKDIILERKYKELESKYNKLQDDYDTLMAEKEVLSIKLSEGKDEKPTEPNKDEKPTEPNKDIKVIEVKNFQEAKEILKGEPYNVAPNRMIQEKAVLNRAEELNIQFKFPE